MDNAMKIMQIDLARQKETPEVIFSLFDIAKKFGFNTVLLYLEDRIKTPCYPYVSDEQSYSREEVLQMVSYADKLRLELIPIVNNLSHTERFLEHEEMQHLAELRGGIKGRFTEEGQKHFVSCCPSLSETYEFFDQYYKEVASLFPSEYFYPGLDEFWDIGCCPLCKKKFDDYGGIGGIFFDHIMHTYNLLKSLGKTMIMADDMFQFCREIVPKLPKDMILKTWCYEYIDRCTMSQFRNNRRVDLLKMYDRLGLRYIPTVWTIFDFNVDSYTAYFKDHKPFGAAATVWQMSADQIITFVPHIAYTGLLWNGVLENDPYERMKLAIKETVDVSDSEAAILALASFSAPLNRAPRQFYFADDILVRRNVNFDDWHKTNRFLLDVLKPIKDKNNFTLNTYMATELAVIMYETFKIAQRLFDFRTGTRDDDIAKIKTALLKIRETLVERFDISREQWAKNRKGLSSDRIERESEVMLSDVDRLISLCDTSHFGEIGCVDLTILMPDKSSLMTTEVIVKYKNGDKKTVCKDVFKPLVTSNYNIMEKGPFMFTVSSAIENADDVEEITLSHSGYGEACVTYVCVRRENEAYIPAEILNTFGRCITPENILINDARCATFGCGDMGLGFDDMANADKVHGITVKLVKE